MIHCATEEEEETAAAAVSYKQQRLLKNCCGLLLSQVDDMISLYFSSGSDKSSMMKHCPQFSAMSKMCHKEKKTRKKKICFMNKASELQDKVSAFLKSTYDERS